MSRRVTAEQVAAFRRHLREDEREPATIRKYLHNVADFAAWLAGEPVSKELVIQWKDHLQRSGQQPVTVNGKLSALNRFFAFLGWSDCRVKHLRIQRRMFRSTARDLTREDYTRLVETAQALGKDRLALLIAVHHGGGRPGGADHHRPQGQAPDHPAAGEALPEAAEIRPEKENRLRGDLSHQKRKGAEPPADLGGDEGSVRQGRGGAEQGVPPQSPASLCPDLLPGLPGRGEAGGCAGPLQY